MTLTILCGSPAAGKSTYAAAHFRASQIIAADECAARLDGASWYRSQQLLHWLVDLRCEFGLISCVDATNLHRPERLRLLEIGRQYGGAVHCVLISCPLERVLARNAAREAPIHEADLRACDRHFTRALDEVEAEGYHSVRLINT